MSNTSDLIQLNNRKLVNSVLIFVEKMYKMQHLEGNSTPVLYIGRTVLKG